MAIQLPNNKISRTLPEQVGFNSAKIEEIIKWINDSGLMNKVLNLSDPSGTLTEAQYEIADLSPSFIVYGGKVFVKSLEDSDNIDFFKVGTDMSGSDSMIASVERVRVVKATKAYQYAVVQLFESYNKTQLDSLLSEKASLTGATFTGVVNAPKFNGENAKPIYCHPITIDKEVEGTADIIHVSFLIFDNSYEEYNTYDKVRAKLLSIFELNPGAVFPCTGAIYYTTGASILIAQKIELFESTTIRIRAVRPNGTLGYFNLQSFNNATFYDGVNKLN